jgi:hypothetical protein
LPGNRKPANFAKERDIYNGIKTVSNPWRGFFTWYEDGGNRRLDPELVRVHIF